MSTRRENTGSEPVVEWRAFEKADGTVIYRLLNIANQEEFKKKYKKQGIKYLGNTEETKNRNNFRYTLPVERRYTPVPSITVPYNNLRPAPMVSSVHVDVKDLNWEQKLWRENQKMKNIQDGGENKVKYEKYKKKNVLGRSSVIFRKKNSKSKKEYIKNKGRYITLKEYIKLKKS